MAEFMLHHTHPAEDCGEIFPELQNVDQSLKVKNFFCTCPGGGHGGFFQVEAGSPEDAVGLLPEIMRASTQVFPGETMAIP